MLQTHSAIYKGKQNHSYHGTTIQLVQPITVPQSNNETTNLSSNTQSRHHHINFSPSTSPHKLGKTGSKWQRTIPISLELRPSSTDQSLQQNIHVPTQTTDQCNQLISSLVIQSTRQPSPYSVTRYAHLTLENFMITTKEKKIKQRCNQIHVTKNSS